MRYEIKYAVECLGFEEILARLLSHPASFRELFPDRIINNVYLDTPEFHCFHQNVEGQPRRKKMRLRWYGDQVSIPKKCTLEIKNKHHELGWKESFQLEDATIKNESDLIETIDSLGIFHTDLAPVLFNSYLRSYYISADGLFRVTIDRNQRFAFPFTDMMPLVIDEFPNVVELKFEKEDEDRAKDVLDYMPFRQTKNSKYTNGVVYLYR